MRVIDDNVTLILAHLPSMMSPLNPSNNINDSSVKQAGGVVTTTALGAKKKPKSLREKNRFGTVIVKVASLSSNRRVQERQNIFTITPRGALFHGTQCNPALVQKGSLLTGEPSTISVAVYLYMRERCDRTFTRLDRVSKCSVFISCTIDGYRSEQKEFMLLTVDCLHVQKSYGEDR